MEDIGQYIQIYCLTGNQFCGENLVRASNSYVKLCIDSKSRGFVNRQKKGVNYSK